MGKCILISNPGKTDQEIPLILRLFENGLNHFHLRKPGYSKAELEAIIMDIPEPYYDRLILHEHYELVEKYQLKGIHITNQHKNQGVEQRFQDYHVSISTHSFEEIRNLNYNYNYAFLSPIFDSISKQQYKSNFNLNEIKTFLNNSEINTPVIALGGIDQNNIEGIRNLGFSGIAVMGSIWKDFSKDPDIPKAAAIYQSMHEITENKAL